MLAECFPEFRPPCDNGAVGLDKIIFWDWMLFDKTVSNSKLTLGMSVCLVMVADTKIESSLASKVRIFKTIQELSSKAA
jgi:hypothetical protein